MAANEPTVVVIAHASPIGPLFPMTSSLDMSGNPMAAQDVKMSPSTWATGREAIAGVGSNFSQCLFKMPIDVSFFFPSWK